MANVFLGLGSNLGDREANLRTALSALAADVTIRLVSALYETDPVGYLEQDAFLNAVAYGTTSLGPHDMLRRGKTVEQQMGRVSAVRWGPRIIDVDILAYDDLCLAEIDLELPHPHLAERAFVLVPLAEVAPLWRHPKLGKSASELLADLGPIAGVRAYKSDWWPS